MSGAGEGRGAGRGNALEDEALVQALGRASCDLAVSDGRGGPPASVWHALARRSARPSRPVGFWHGHSSLWPLAAGLAVAVIALVGVVRWRNGRGAGWSAGGSDPHRITASGEAGRGTSGAPLTFAVAGASLGSGDEIDAAGRSKAEVRFSDGTDIGLYEGARLAVAGRSADGARLRLRSGRARFQVVHRPRAAWTVDAGPYVIEVTGTVFDVRWSEAAQTIEVRMQSGSVRVSGPLLSARMPLRTGQRLVVRPADGDVRLDEGRLDEGRVSGGSTGDDAAEAPVVPDPAAQAGPANSRAGDGQRATAPVIDADATGPLRSGVPLSLAAPPAADPVSRRARVRARLALARDISGAFMPAGEPGRSNHSTTGDLPAGQGEPLPSLEAPPGPSPAQAQDDTPSRPPPLAGAEAPVAAAAYPKTSPNLWRQRRWSTKVAAGESQAVVADAERIGMKATLAGADSQSLAALADAARYAGRPDLADKALVEERRRFPGGARAQAAAFLLGRAADDRGDLQGGLAWYRRYLTEAPGGPYAAEALGREMLAVEKLQGRGAAVSLAAEYLRRFPNGTYLLRARALLDDR